MNGKFFDLIGMKRSTGMSTSTISKLNPKDITTRIAADVLGMVFEQARNEVAKKMMEVARGWGATIPTESETQFLNQIGDLFSPPAAWPSVEIVGGVSNSSGSEGGGEIAVSKKAPGSRKRQTSDKAPKSTKKAADFRSLTVVPGQAVPKCPAIMKSGDRKDQPCGRECNKVTDEHDTSIAECARNECGHCFCGTHVVKAAEATGGNVSKNRDADDPDKKPVFYNDDGGETKINSSAIGTIDQGRSADVTRSTMEKLKAKMAARRDKKAEEDQ